MERVTVVALAILAGCAALLGCGPSYHALYEGNAHFEHCYALEENPQAAMGAKAACWHDWSSRYTFGQTRDRIRYATARYVALSQAANAPTDEAMMLAAPGESRITTITAPAPTSATEPPPKTLDLDAGAPPAHPSDFHDVLGGPPDAGANQAVAQALPSSSCVDPCAATFRKCHATCGKNEAACKKCEAPYGPCMKACFK